MNILLETKTKPVMGNDLKLDGIKKKNCLK